MAFRTIALTSRRGYLILLQPTRSSPVKWFRETVEEFNEAVLDPALSLKVDSDEQALSKIRSLCAVVMADAGRVARSYHDDRTKAEKLRFESARRLSLHLTKTIVETSLRDAALQQIIELCMTANDLDTPRILVRGIQSGEVREKLLEEYPVIFY
jgi:hypothetical protein